MFPPASKKVATGGPFGSKGNGGVVRSTGIPPRPPAGGAPLGAPPWRPRPPLGGPLLACIQRPEKSGFPSAVRGIGASPRTLPLASRGTFASRTVGHCAAMGSEAHIRTPNPRTVVLILLIIIPFRVLRLATFRVLRFASRAFRPIRGFADRPVAADGHHSIDVQLHPAQAGKCEFAFQKSGGGCLRVIANQESSVHQLDDGADYVETGRACGPADFRQAGQVHIVGFVAQRCCERRGTHAGPDVGGAGRARYPDSLVRV